MRVTRLALALLVGMGMMTLGFGCGESGSETTVTVTKTETAEPPDGPGASNPPPSSGSKTRLTSYTGSLYTARVPAGWTLEKDEQGSGDFLRSQWRDPSDPNTSVLVDAVDGEAESPAEKAQAVRDATSATAGYREVSFGPTTLQGLDAYRWIFMVSGDKRIDYFVNECGVGIAVLGSTSPSTFETHADLFRRVARSVQPDCSEPPPDDPPPPAPEENCEDGYDPCVPPYSEGDVDCPDVGGPISVTGDDPHGLDADGDGVGCE